ncbi:hypothetical protein KUV64_14895 [Mameliella alba]|uniref:hypothetical protein n=1 Tax=Mameliella alba TaxID=561184 RepID=UPI001C97C1EA|nr:hypothetical protein [Mameliella alba]MBY6120419.1 hypothetical protein [Mameliella alba]
MIRIALLFAMLCALASCAQYREPEANCFAFRASHGQADPECTFTPLQTPEDGVDN